MHFEREIAMGMKNRVQLVVKAIRLDLQQTDSAIIGDVAVGVPRIYEVRRQNSAVSGVYLHQALPTPYFAIISSLELLESLRPRVIVLDVMMPGMSGMDVLRRIRSDEKVKDVPVVVFSADFSLATERSARQLGVQAFIVKGTVAWTELLDTIVQYASA